MNFIQAKVSFLVSRGRAVQYEEQMHIESRNHHSFVSFTVITSLVSYEFETKIPGPIFTAEET